MSSQEDSWHNNEKNLEISCNTFHAFSYYYLRGGNDKLYGAYRAFKWRISVG